MLYKPRSPLTRLLYIVLHALTRHFPPFLSYKGAPWMDCTVVYDTIKIKNNVFFCKTLKQLLPSLCNCVFTGLWTFYPDSFILYASLNLIWYLNCYSEYKCIRNTRQKLPFCKDFFEHSVISLQTSVIKTSLLGYWVQYSRFSAIWAQSNAVGEKQCYRITDEAVTWDDGVPSLCCLSPVHSLSPPPVVVSELLLERLSSPPHRRNIKPLLCV